MQKSQFLIAVLTLFYVSINLADQNDQQLTSLFSELNQNIEQQRGLEITNEIWSIWHNTADVNTDKLMRSGVAFMQSGRLTDALEQFDRVVELSPDFAEGWNKRATVLFYLEQFDASVSDIEKTLNLEPRHFGALSGLGMIYMSYGKYKAALVAFQNAQRINPHLPGITSNIDRISGLLSKELI
ncbi:MAG: tetratricopeptide (TPR) repeat protein [Parasphingorhabdus sp.]|jgi:tetratricopeptide (TPR) repeat protein